MPLFKNFFKYKKINVFPLHQMTEDYFALQAYLLKLEKDSNAINEEVIFVWTKTTNFSLQKKVIYQQIRDYDRQPWVFKIWDWLKGYGKQVEIKRKWLAFQSYNKLLRGIVYPEPILALSEKKLSSLVKVRRRIPSALKLLLESFSQSLQRFSADPQTINNKLNATLHILNSGRYIMYGKKPTRKTDTSRNPSYRVNQALDKEIDEIKNSLHQIYFLCGIFDLNYSNLNPELIQRRYSEYLEMLNKFNKEKVYSEIESFHSKLVSIYASLNQPDKQRLCDMIKKDEAESLNEAKIHGLNLRLKYNHYIATPAVIKFSDKAEQSSDSLVVLKQKAQPAMSPASESISDKVLVANFIRACGFYGIVVFDNSAFDKLTKAHRAMQIKIHPDKLNRDFEFKGQNIPIRISLDSYLKKRSEFFDRLNMFFNLKLYAKKTINFNTLRQHEKSLNYDLGVKKRKEFDSRFNLAESQHNLHVESEKEIYELTHQRLEIAKDQAELAKDLAELAKDQAELAKDQAELAKSFAELFIKLNETSNNMAKKKSDEPSQALDIPKANHSKLKDKPDEIESVSRNWLKFNDAINSSNHSIKQKTKFFAEPISARSIIIKQEPEVMRRKSI